MVKVAIISTNVYKLDYRNWKARQLIMQIWLNSKAHFSAAYVRVQKLQRTSAQANFYAVNYMAFNTTHYTKASYNELQKFLKNIAVEHPEPPIPLTVKIQALKT